MRRVDLIPFQKHCAVKFSMFLSSIKWKERTKPFLLMIICLGLRNRRSRFKDSNQDTLLADVVVDVPDYSIVVFELRKGLAKSEIISSFTLDLSFCMGAGFGQFREQQWVGWRVVDFSLLGHVAKNRKSDAYLFLRSAKQLLTLPDQICFC